MIQALSLMVALCGAHKLERCTVNAVKCDKVKGQIVCTVGLDIAKEKKK